jgi:hypothetical protein
VVTPADATPARRPTPDTGENVGAPEIPTATGCPDRSTPTSKLHRDPEFVLEFFAPAPQLLSAAANRPAVKPAAFKRRQFLDAEQLRQQLLHLPEVSLTAVPTTLPQIVATAQADRRGILAGPSPSLLKNPGLVGLPFRRGTFATMGKEPAENLHVLSQQMRRCLDESVPGDGTDCRRDPERLRRRLLENPGRLTWQRAEAIPCLMQTLSVENTPLRLLLVEILDGIPGRDATTALARLALFDLSAQVRGAAVAALKKRPRDDGRPTLLAGLSYPWAPAADHAAEALVALDDQEAVPFLRALASPVAASEPAVVSERTPARWSQEVVRIPHLTNCLLCHPPSFSPRDLARGAVPSPGTVSAGYNQGDVFVRADITFLRQDFSVMQPVAQPDGSLEYQRLDFLVRTRPGSSAEADLGPAQRQAVLFALRELGAK